MNESSNQKNEKTNVQGDIKKEQKVLKNGKGPEAVHFYLKVWNVIGQPYRKSQRMLCCQIPVYLNCEEQRCHFIKILTKKCQNKTKQT